MKKIIPFVFFTIVAMNTTPVWADKTEKKASISNTVSKANENKLSEEEITCMTERLKEIRDMDKKNLTADQKHELRKEVVAMKEQMRKSGGVIIIPACTLIIILLIILLI